MRRWVSPQLTTSILLAQDAVKSTTIPYGVEPTQEEQRIPSLRRPNRFPVVLSPNKRRLALLRVRNQLRSGNRINLLHAFKDDYHKHDHPAEF